MDLQQIVETSDSITYTGRAQPWVPTSKIGWQISKTEVAGTTTTVKYPVGSKWKPTSGFDFVWDDRAVLNFSFTDDTTAPTLTTCTIASNNSDTTRAKVGDTVTVTIVGSEYLTAVTATIAGHAATVTQGIDEKHYTATYTMASGDTEGSVLFSIGYSDIAGRAGIAVTTTTDSSAVAFDKTPIALVSAISGSSTQITVTLSELALASTITKSNDGGFVVHDTITPATTYAVSAIAPGSDNTKVVLTVADTTASTGNGLTITYAHSENGTVSDRAGNALATNATGVTIAWA